MMTAESLEHDADQGFEKLAWLLHEYLRSRVVKEHVFPYESKQLR